MVVLVGAVTLVVSILAAALAGAITSTIFNFSFEAGEDLSRLLDALSARVPAVRTLETRSQTTAHVAVTMAWGVGFWVLAVGGSFVVGRFLSGAVWTWLWFGSILAFLFVPAVVMVALSPENRVEKLLSFVRWSVLYALHALVVVALVLTAAGALLGSG